MTRAIQYAFVPVALVLTLFLLLFPQDLLDDE